MTLFAVNNSEQNRDNIIPFEKTEKTMLSHCANKLFVVFFCPFKLSFVRCCQLVTTNRVVINIFFSCPLLESANKPNLRLKHEHAYFGN